LTNDLNNYESVSISSDARLVVATQRNDSSSIWIGPADDPDKAKQITFGRMDGQRGLSFTPDNRIVFTANHEENWDLFIAEGDGRDVRQLTFDRHYHSWPTVCEGGRSVVYGSDINGLRHLWKIDLRTGATTQLTNGQGEIYPQCGPQGETVYFGSQAPSGEYHVYKIPATGGTASEVSPLITFSRPEVSWDEKHILFAHPQEDGKVIGQIVAAATGEPEFELENPTSDPKLELHVQGWMPDGRHLVMSDIRTGSRNLWAIAIMEKRQGAQLTHFNSGGIWAACYSPDGKLIAIARGPYESDAVLFSDQK
jgi:Tol biopolymer transport system component